MGACYFCDIMHFLKLVNHLRIGIDACLCAFASVSIVCSLFPTMPRHNLYKIQPHVKALCAKYNIPYKLKSLSEAFIDIVR